MSAYFALLLLGTQLLVHQWAYASPITQQQQHEQPKSQPEQAQQQFQSDFDYSRFYFGNNNLAALYDKKSAPASSGPWYAAAGLPRQLAPKFKRDFNSYGVHDKRLDEQLFDDFYSNMQPNRYEWNFNRL